MRLKTTQDNRSLIKTHFIEENYKAPGHNSQRPMKVTCWKRKYWPPLLFPFSGQKKAHNKHNHRVNTNPEVISQHSRDHTPHWPACRTAEATDEPTFSL